MLQRPIGLALLVAALAAPLAAHELPPPTPAEELADLVDAALAVRIPTLSAAEHAAAAATWRALLDRVVQLDPEGLDPEAAVDRDLLERWLRSRLFEVEEIALWKVVPVRYLSLPTTDSLFLRPCGQPDRVVREAAEELRRFPDILAHGRENLERPARPWTEYALEHARYVRMLLVEEVPTVCVAEPGARDELVAAAAEALPALDAFVAWMRSDLLPRSDRSPAWTPGEIETYQLVHEGLDGWDVDAMLALAEGEAVTLREEMEALARRIHPSGDLRTVWELMKEEAPPWEEVVPMAERYVAMSTAWLQGPGREVLEIPANLDYGVRITSPLGRRLLSFGGADYGPTLAGRLSGYYVLTPLEPWLDEAGRTSRIKAYNPYWTHVIAVHEWVGHNVQRAIALAHPQTPMRAAYPGIYLSQAWSFYLEGLLEGEGYYEGLPHLEKLKTLMARRQMRMWRVQRILTKLRMAKGTMTFEEAVRAYVEEIGMEPANALVEVQRDSMSPSPPGREIVGERVILELRDEFARRAGPHFRLRDFHRALLAWGEVPLPIAGRLMLGE